MGQFVKFGGRASSGQMLEIIRLRQAMLLVESYKNIFLYFSTVGRCPFYAEFV